MDKKRTRAELLEETFRYMWYMGDLTKTTVQIVLATGGVKEKTIYKVAPRPARKP